MRKSLIKNFRYELAKIAFTQILFSLKIYEYPDSDFLFFKKENNDSIWMELNKENGNLWISYSLIWSKFETNFGFKDELLIKLYKEVVEEAWKLNEVTFTKFIRRK